MANARRRGITLKEHIRLDLPDGQTFEVEPSIFHWTEEHWVGFADAEILWCEPIMHRFDLCLTRELFESGMRVQGRGLDEAVVDDRWEALRAA
jgi:hypothetical protein